MFDGWLTQFGHRQRLHRRVTEPNKFDECSLTLHHWSDDDFGESFFDINDNGVEGLGTKVGITVRNGNDNEGGGEFELDELELSDVDEELVGDLDDERIAANECGCRGSVGGGGGGAMDERKSTVLSVSRACKICKALWRIIASVWKRSNGDQETSGKIDVDDDGEDEGEDEEMKDARGDASCFSILIELVEQGLTGIGRAIVGVECAVEVMRSIVKFVGVEDRFVVGMRNGWAERTILDCH